MEVNLINTFINPVNKDDFLKSLEQLTKLCLDSECRATLPPCHFKDLSTVLEKFADKAPIRYDILTEGYRFLRNSVAACTRSQDIIREETTLFQSTCSILNRIVEEEDASQNPSTEAIVTLRCSLQFLANSMTDNPKNCITVCSQFWKILEKLIHAFGEDEKVVQYSAMVTHLAMKLSPEEFMVNSKPALFKVFLQNLHMEFVIYAMESWVRQESFIRDYEDLESRERIKILSFLNARPDLLEGLKEQVISTLKTDFIQRSDFILKSKIDDKDNVFCWEIAILLELLCAVSALETASLKTDPALLITTICLLKQIDAAGKEPSESENVFTPVEDLAKLTSKSIMQDDTDVDIRGHPTFQFKAHLIRLIANLAHRNKTNQDKVRELECLLIILDSCKLDARNPFIAQWSILAVRNLCEGNEANQCYIREVQRIDTEKLLPNLHLVEVEKDSNCY